MMRNTADELVQSLRRRGFEEVEVGDGFSSHQKGELYVRVDSDQFEVWRWEKGEDPEPIGMGVNIPQLDQYVGGA